MLLSQLDGVRMPMELAPQGEECVFLVMTICQACARTVKTEGLLCMLKNGFQGNINISV